MTIPANAQWLPNNAVNRRTIDPHCAIDRRRQYFSWTLDKPAM
jgi:hypothetical protein